jgi:cell division protein FtsI (penicillin-binding protein 3)
LRFLFLVFGLLFLLIVGRSFQIQVIRQEKLIQLSKDTAEKVLVLNSLRGDIYDCHLEKLATSVTAENLSVHGADIEDTGETFLALSRVLNMDYENLASRLERAIRYAVIKRDLSEEETANVRALKLPGVTIEKGYKRIYPNGSLAAHLLGFVGIDGNGLEGLELALNDSLMAQEVRIRVPRNKRGQIIIDSPDMVREPPRGASVMLTLDRRIQFIAEKAIARAVLETNAKSGIAIAVRVRTGDIVASAIYPTYDPNNYQKADLESRRNIVLTDPFEPGSTFKVFTVAAGLEEGLITPDKVFFCENGFYKVDGNTVIRDTSAHGDLTVSQIVQVSSNICAAKIGERLGPTKLYNYLTRFSFGEKSGLAYPAGESTGRLRPVQDWHRVDAANIAFGQGLSVTALQLVMAVAALGNDGILMRPRLVSRVIDSEGNIVEMREPEIIRQVVSPLTAHQVLAMMRMAVLKGGTGMRGDIPEYPIAGKTGTSQKYNNQAGLYSHDQFIASYVGLAPYEKPELCLLVVLDEPWPRYYGGIVAAPVFKEIMSEALPLLDIPPKEGSEVVLPHWPVGDPNPNSAPGVLPDYSKTNYVRVSLPKGDQGEPGPIVLDEVPEVNNPTPVRYLPPGIMPDLKGLTIREVLNVVAPFRLLMEYHGSGVAVTQDPPAGTAVVEGQMAWVEFSGVGS